jgi:dsDNA-specific endonuclease/ATPase MutS2
MTAARAALVIVRRYHPKGIESMARDRAGHGPPEGDAPFDEPVPVPLDGTLDLHAFRASDVAELVPEWLEACRAAGLRDLRIVHGKGTGALRRTVEAILGRHPLVASFRTAGEDAGGWGATLVTLR